MATNKNKKTETAAAQAAPSPENQAAQDAPETVAETSAEGKTAAAAPEPEKADKKAEAKATATKEGKKPNSATSVLEKAGKAAIARHGFKEVFVTSDGQAFPLRSDAQHHAADLTSKEIINVTK